jgi:hypothetical protein
VCVSNSVFRNVKNGAAWAQLGLLVTKKNVDTQNIYTLQYYKIKSFELNHIHIQRQTSALVM